MNTYADTRLRALARSAALAALLLAGPPALAQTAPQIETPRIDVGRGTLLIHGNFCGPGSRGPGHPPIDALDRACAQHDACTPERSSGRLPHCACNDRLHVEAEAVARDPRTPRSVRDTAQFIADGAEVLPCAD